MSKPGCCCKSAKEPNPNCAYCGNKNQQVYYDDNNYYPSDYNAQNQYAYDPYGQYGYGQGSEYSYGSDKDGGPYSNYSQYSDDGEDNSNWDLVKPVIVFGVGCYLTTKMMAVANELG